MRKRIFISFIALIVLFGALSSLLVSSIIASVVPGQVISRLESEMKLLTRRIEERGSGEAFRQLLSVSRVTHIAADGTVLYDSMAGQNLENHADREEVRQALRNGSGSAVRYSSTLKANLIYLARRLPDGSVLRLAAPERVSREMASNMLPWQIFGTIGLILLSLPLAAFLTSLLMRPIMRINLDNPDDSLVYNELMPLVRRIDEQAKLNRKQMEALNDRRQELAALLGGMHEGFVAIDQNHRIILINQSACDMLGIDRDWAVGKTMPEVNRRQEMLALLDELEKNGSAQGAMDRGGRSYALSASKVESRRGAVLLISDQTDKVEGDAMRKRFTANVSHELRTPLTTLCGYAEMIEKGMVKPADIPSFNGIILKESKRMLSLIEDILRLSKLDEGFPRGSRDKLALNVAAESACESLRQQAQDKDVALHFEGDEAFVAGDRTLLEELCVNLIDNAIKYNQPGGRVDVSVRNAGQQAVLTVRDTGIGIEPEHQTRIFERFYRTDKSRSKATGGTGLGLSIVKHAAEYHGAKIALESAPGQGTSISVTFPAYQKNDNK